ncbi:hypothetical protein GCM10010236_07030 [Streptomyces eurythermus]|nr:hypothetical protein GCM10010236_07030 [Streptomyces eurythermus]
MVVQGVFGAFAVSAGVLIAYRTRWIRVTRRFAGSVAAAATGFLLLLAAGLLFSAFGAGNGLGMHRGGLGILFGVLGVLLGAAFLALDFRQLEDAVAHGAPREEAWPAAFGLTTTLVWIHREVLRVLTVFNSALPLQLSCHRQCAPSAHTCERRAPARRTRERHLLRCR